MKKYYKVWFKTSSLTIQQAFSNRSAAIFFLAGKWIRFASFIYFIKLIGKQGQTVSGYSGEQLVVFFLVFNLFDLFGQIFFRGIYWFREQVVSGEFDFRLIKPMNPLFQALTRQTDILDVPMFVYVIYSLINQIMFLSLIDWLWFSLLTLGAMIIITAIHILVAALGVFSTEVDHTIMIYRDLSAMARFPIDIYHETIRLFLTYIIPIAFAFTMPAKALLRMIEPLVVIYSVAVALVILWMAYRIWEKALTQYISASS